MKNLDVVLFNDSDSEIAREAITEEKNIYDIIKSWVLMPGDKIEIQERNMMFHSNDYIEKAIEKRSESKCWYILHYNINTTEYLNEIEFITYKEVCESYEKETSYNEEDRVELMFAPEQEDEEFENNVIIKQKMTKRNLNK